MTMAEMVEEFHKRVGAPIGETPLDDEDYLHFRECMLMEEMLETDLAQESGIRADYLDGIVDQLYVLMGTGIAVFGAIVMDEAFLRVHESNMTKDPAGKGKATKGDGFIPVNLENLV